MMRSNLLSTLLVCVSLHGVLVDATDSVLGVHGSGTSNPARCYGSVIEELQARSKVPLRMTYRSVGSSIGLEEFVNEFNPLRSADDFGSGEIPLSTEQWQTFQDANVTVMQLPTLFGAVSFFHSVPDMPNLNLTSCLLARIFMRDIKDWAHPDIREINPGLDRLFAGDNSNSLGASLRIRVARREEGSSNTNAITQYLRVACPQHFPADMVGPLPEWPIDTEACRGTLGMNDCITQRAGTIGYNDAGIGLFAGLDEISIKNKYGRLLTSQIAAANGGIGAKESGVLPSDPTADFGRVSLLDQQGEYTWPITLLTYIYIRTDLSFKTDPAERGLLITFLKALYDPNYVSRCQSNYGFFLADGPALELGMKGIELLESVNISPEDPQWTFEDKPEPIVGAGAYVLSSNRRNFPAVEREHNLDGVQDLRAVILQLEEQVATLQTELENPSSGGGNDEAEFSHKYEAMIVAGLTMATLSLIFVLGLAAVVITQSRAGGK
ncbi:Inherit from COG: phosphate abc transporter [Seminavis robusta]|uniref:Inherit from COG: phosphate abc transporter n=1 Tax=Seminavis robusta TaxID=568900 RepID=A0A9N8HT92_9STRA|nr:Inherit from COG: phosphate abc transporter [Seminavis robusta]CAB9528547.1 Inherit from COG: phosphate abc transporter [Seminavis robusta]|eukprot:Sro1546_g281460.1 Inherit from COG: phosphate abc transporter (495) ;mRNA; r:23496-25075